MNIKIDVYGGRAGAWFDFSCNSCGCNLDELEDGNLEHPAFETGIFGGIKKDKPINCKYAGKKFQHPFAAVELKPI